MIATSGSCHISIQLLWVALFCASSVLADRYPIAAFGFTGIKLERLSNRVEERSDRKLSEIGVESQLFVSKSQAAEQYPEYWFEQPLDHFQSEFNKSTFRQRYWISERHYEVGGPIIVLDGGETSGEDRLPFLDTGIVNILANATRGIGIVLEHRYYGKSVAVGNLTTDSLKWLSNAQAAADSANFIRNVKLPGVPKGRSPPVIYYGGSYAGARAAHMKILYPDLIYGAIGSSAVTHAQIEFPEYYEIIREAAPGNCGRHISQTVELVDFALSSPLLRILVKRLFGLQDLEEDVEFVLVLSRPLSKWQAKVWDPAVGSSEFDDFCAFLQKRPWDGKLQNIFAPFPFYLLNYAQWIRETVVSRCAEKGDSIPESIALEGLGGHIVKRNLAPVVLSKIRALICIYKASPKDNHHPRLISRLVTLEYLHSSCQKAFPPGDSNSIPAWPNVTIINELGGFGIAADRLALIDGEVDPWRPATPHSSYAEPRTDTLLRPFKLIPNAVHHYDEYGLKDIDLEPPEILAIHKEMITFVKDWLQNYHEFLSEQ